MLGFGKKKSNPEDEIRKLSRTELLEMLIEETKEAERLKEENEKLSAELNRCKADLDRAASLAVIIQQLEDIIGKGAVSKAAPAGQEAAAKTAAGPEPAGIPASEESPIPAVRTVPAPENGADMGFRYTTKDPQGFVERARAEEAAEPFPPLGEVVQIRMVGFRLAGQKKWGA